MTVYYFAGPSLPPQLVPRGAASGAVRLGPIRHGDLLAIDLTAADTVAIIDGVFYMEPPVRHKEILDALSRGATVVGGASMGALRAAEMSVYGMVGIGRVFELYASGELTADDEVALLHSDEAHGSRPLSVSLVSVREACRLLTEEGLLASGEAGALVAELAAVFYTDRTVQRVRHAGRGLEIADPVVDRLVGMIDGSPADVKVRDALRVLDAAVRLPARSANVPGPWLTDNVVVWRNTFALERPDPASVLSERLALQGLQLANASFPLLYSDVVCEALARAWGVRNSAACLAAEFSRRTGIAQVTHDLASQWLYPEPAQGATDNLLRLAVATYREQPNLPPWEGVLRRLRRLRALDDVAAACSTVVERSAASAARALGPRRTELASLADAVEWVADLWRLPPEPDAVRCAAYMRGFRSIEHVYEVARKFVSIKGDEHSMKIIRDTPLVADPATGAVKVARSRTGEVRR